MKASAHATYNVYALVGPDGLAYVGLHQDAADAWRVALGWPAASEVEARKAEGWYVTRATLTWQREESTTTAT